MLILNEKCEGSDLAQSGFQLYDRGTWWDALSGKREPGTKERQLRIARHGKKRENVWPPGKSDPPRKEDISSMKRTRSCGKRGDWILPDEEKAPWDGNTGVGGLAPAVQQAACASSEWTSLALKRPPNSVHGPDRERTGEWGNTRSTCFLSYADGSPVWVDRRTTAYTLTGVHSPSLVPRIQSPVDHRTLTTRSKWAGAFGCSACGVNVRQMPRRGSPVARCERLGVSAQDELPSVSRTRITQGGCAGVSGWTTRGERRWGRECWGMLIQLGQGVISIVQGGDAAFIASDTVRVLQRGEEVAEDEGRRLALADAGALTAYQWASSTIASLDLLSTDDRKVAGGPGGTTDRVILKRGHMTTSLPQQCDSELPDLDTADDCRLAMLQGLAFAFESQRPDPLNKRPKKRLITIRRYQDKLSKVVAGMDSDRDMKELNCLTSQHMEPRDSEESQPGPTILSLDNDIQQLETAMSNNTDMALVVEGTWDLCEGIRIVITEAIDGKGDTMHDPEMIATEIHTLLIAATEESERDKGLAARPNTKELLHQLIHIRYHSPHGMIAVDKAYRKIYRESITKAIKSAWPESKRGARDQVGTLLYRLVERVCGKK
ncbi:hypothetical protein C8R43DRAFT_961530 [Mycena crocata]|nr:hypothetical protein C8R43DRAFT_961530 [Mycena crocata]